MRISSIIIFIGKLITFLRKKVKLTDGKGILTTDSLDYEVSTKTGVFKKGGKLVREKTILTSKEGVYYGETRNVIFRNKVELHDPENQIITDTLEYNTYSQVANFNSPSKIITGPRTITTSNGNFCAPHVGFFICRHINNS